MFRAARALPAGCLIACLVLAPTSRAFASDRTPASADATPEEGAPAAPGETALPRRIINGVRPASIVLGELPAAQKRQTVATTNEPKLLLGIAAGALIVTGVAMITYGATSTCKGLHGEFTNSCDKKTVIGAMAVTGGTVMLVVWGLSRP